MTMWMSDYWSPCFITLILQIWSLLNWLCGRTEPELQETSHQLTGVFKEKPVKTEYFACIGSSFTLQCKVRGVQDIKWQRPNSTETEVITRKIACMNEESAGEYICKVPGCSDVITLSILQPGEQQAFVNDDVKFDATNCTTNKAYKWTYIGGDKNETDINDKNTRKLTIKGCRQEDNGIYICRDKKTDEQLTAYRLKTKYNIKGNLTLNGSPEDKEFKQNLIKGTERLLTTPDHVVEIRISERSEEDSSYQIPLVAYLTQGRNKTEFEELMNFDKKAVCVLFIAEHRSLPDIPLDREHIAIRFTKFPNTVKCSFYDDSQKNTWIKLLKEYTGKHKVPM